MTGYLLRGRKETINSLQDTADYWIYNIGESKLWNFFLSSETD